VAAHRFDRAGGHRIISDEVFTTAGIDPAALRRTEITIRGRNEPIIVRTAEHATVLAGFFHQTSDAMKRKISVAEAAD